jgi:UDP-glucose 4-epimerase
VTAGANEASAHAFYRDRRVLVTGGLGFIGSNLCIALAGLGARVEALDSLLPECGGNVRNLSGYEDAVRVHQVDLRDPEARAHVRDQEVIFNLAGQVSHVDSMTDPLKDLEINGRSQLCLLEAVRHENPQARVVYAGTRQVYGRPQYLPVDEKHPLQPTDVNGVDKISGEMFHLVYHAAHGVRASSLRLSNTYGERQLVKHPRQGFIGWFVGRAVRGEEITVFGDGAQKRDFNHVSDVVDAFLRAGASDAAAGRVFNLGGGPAVSLLELARLLVDLAGRGSVRLVPFPKERARIDIGDFCADTSLARETLGWAPKVPLREGLARTVAFYRERLEHYL